MSRTIYPQEAIDLCLELYLRFGGANYNAIEREMQKIYPGWQKQLLFSKGKGKNARLGWIDKFGFERALKLHLENKIEKVQDDTQRLYNGIKKVRERLEKKALSEDASPSDLDKYAKYCDLEIKARQALELSKSNLETFAEAFELICGWLAEINAEVAKGFVKSGDKLIERAQIHYGKSEEQTINE